MFAWAEQAHLPMCSAFASPHPPLPLECLPTLSALPHILHEGFFPMSVDGFYFGLSCHNIIVFLNFGFALLSSQLSVCCLVSYVFVVYVSVVCVGLCLLFTCLLFMCLLCCQLDVCLFKSPLSEC